MSLHARHALGMDDDATIRLVSWTGPFADDDPDANFKADVALYSHVDPLATIRNLARALKIPVGGLCHYVLAKWATQGSGGLLELGPTMVRRLAGICDEAEAVGTDDARLAAYLQLRGLTSWLAFPLDHPDVYPQEPPEPTNS
jgi:hypothetical protein